MEVFRDQYLISTNKAKLNIEFIHHSISGTYWGKNIPMDIVRKSIEGSICFGLYVDSKQIGFARVITDCATFGYLADVFIDENYRGKGLGFWLVREILDYKEFQGLRRMLLGTRDAHGLYTKLGFTSIPNPEAWMHIHRPDIYKTYEQEN